MASNHVALVTAGGLTNATIAHSLYGYCTTAAATAAKTVTMYKTGSTAGAAWDAADLFHGLTITVRFQYSNTVASPTLNVNSTGAKPIYRYGTTAPGTSVAASWPAQAVVQLTYDLLLNTSGCWVMNDYKDDNNTTYSAGSGLSLSTTTFNHASTVTAGTAGTSSATSGISLAVPYVTYNGTGHITAAGTHTHTVCTSNLTEAVITATTTKPTSVSATGWNYLRFGTIYIAWGIVNVTGINTTAYMVSGIDYDPTTRWIPLPISSRSCQYASFGKALSGSTKWNMWAAPSGAMTDWTLASGGHTGCIPFYVGTNGTTSNGQAKFPVWVVVYPV